MCPLCNYNLRGLVEARCPECGYRFEWKELLNRLSWEHPWLFEHSARGRSFFRTLLVGLSPRRFWASVLPMHPPRVGRLIRYWVYMSLSFLVPALALHVIPMVPFYYAVYENRQRSESILASPGFLNLGSGYRYFYQDYPPLWWVWEQARVPLYATTAGDLALAGLLWPWLTALTLAIFWRTIRRARIHPAHILRCTIYSAGVFPLLLPVLVGGIHLFEFHLTSPWRTRTILLGWEAFILCFLAAAIMSWRLIIAYREYLRFPHAEATCVAVQSIVLLALLAMSDWRFLF